MTTKASLQRETFTTSRLLEFFTEKELSLQIGFDKGRWPAALLKELIDNSLDACELAGLPPQIQVSVGTDFVSVRDNGPGLAPAIVERSLDYAVRVSSNAYYVSPTRGQLGNAFKCVWAAPFVVDSEHGRVEVAAQGVQHRIDIRLDRIGQKPRLEHGAAPSDVKSGTVVTMHWPQIASSLGHDGEATFYSAHDLLTDYATFNPHAQLTLVEGRRKTLVQATTAPAWKKWLPSSPTSPHWYSPEQFRSLIAAFLAEERAGGRPRTVQQFIKDFAGLSGTAKQKQVASAAGLAGAWLRDLVQADDVDADRAGKLLIAMQSASRVIKSKELGVLGEAHLTRCLVDYHGVDPESVRYKRALGTQPDRAFVLEVALGVKTCDEEEGAVLAGVNWSPALQLPFTELFELLGEMRIDDEDPVVLLVHLACPGVTFTDRGKSRLALPEEIIEALEKCVRTVAKPWKEAKRSADRMDRVQTQRLEELRKAKRRKRLSIKAAAWAGMGEAYLKVSNNGQYPANARQIMYAARPGVLQRTGGTCWKKSSYFTQHLLPDFIEAHPEATADWDVVFDNRGRLREPHTGRVIHLGTVAVRDYIAAWQPDVTSAVEKLRSPTAYPTMGPAHRYRFALFIEKEGFDALLDAANIAGRFDVAILSTKGMSVTAARILIERLGKEGVTILVLHDFDKSGLGILHTLYNDTRRYKFHTKPHVIDLGLRLEDIHAMRLETEPVFYKTGQKNPIDPRDRLRAYGASAEEIAFLMARQTASGWAGERCELNAMSSPSFIEFLERKLCAAGVTKLVPAEEALAAQFRRASKLLALQSVIDAELARNDTEVAVPDGLTDLVLDRIRGTGRSWDEAVWQIASGRTAPGERGV